MKYILDVMVRIGLRRLLIGIISVMIVIPLFCCLLMIPLSLSNGKYLNPLYLVVPFGLFFLLLIVGGIIAFGMVIWLRTRTLDGLFVPLGLEGSPNNLYYRCYEGKWQNREVGVYFNRGPMMTMEMATSLQTRMGISENLADTRYFSSFAGKTPLTRPEPELQGLVIFPQDEAWARRLLDIPEAKQIIRRLVLDKSWFNRKQVLLRPGWFSLLYTGTNQLLSFDFKISPQEARGWLEDLCRLAILAESLPPPQKIEVDTAADRMATAVRRKRKSINKIQMAIVIFIIFGMPIIFVGIAAIVTLLILALK